MIAASRALISTALPGFWVLRHSSAMCPLSKRLTVAVSLTPVSSKLKFSLSRRLGRRSRCAVRLRSVRVSSQFSQLSIFSCGRVAEGVFSSWIVLPSRSSFRAPRTLPVAGLLISGSGGPVRLDSPLKTSLLSKTPFAAVGQAKSFCCPEMEKLIICFGPVVATQEGKRPFSCAGGGVGSCPAIFFIQKLFGSMPTFLAVG